jgi:hypothetical protein
MRAGGERDQTWAWLDEGAARTAPDLTMVVLPPAQKETRRERGARVEIPGRDLRT